MTVSKKKQFIITYYIPIVLIVSVLGMTVVTAMAHRTPVWEAVSFFLFQVFCMILPGAAMNAMMPIRQLSRVETVLISYVWGHVLNIGVYLLTVPFGLGACIKVVYIVLTLISVGILICKTDRDHVSDFRIGRDELTGISVIVVLFMISLIIYSMRWAMTEQGKDFHNDLLFWIGNTIALKEQFLPIDFRSLYDNYKYHYFGSMQQAVAAIVTGMPVFNLAVRYSYIGGVLIFGLATSCFVMRIVKKSKAVLLTLVLILFATGWEREAGLTYLWHIYMVPMSFEIALGFELVILLLLFIQNDEKRVNPYILIAVAFYLAVCTGTKGPSGMFVVCGIGVMCIYWMFVRKEYTKSILYGIVALASFGFVYVTLLATRQQGYVMESAVEVAGNVSDTVQAADTLRVLGGKLSAVAMWLAGYFSYIFLVNPWTFVPAILFSLYRIVRRNISIEQTILLVMVVIGSVLGYHIQYEGDSQMYFTLAVCPFAAVLAGTGVDNICILRQVKGKIRRMMADIALVVLLAAIGCVTVNGNYKNRLLDHIRIGLAVLCDEPYEQTGWNWIMSQSEYQAYDWIRENTEPDAVFLSDTFFINGYHSYYYPGVFTERRIFFYRNDGDIEPGRACYDGDESAVGILKEKGIDYIIQNKYRSPDFRLSETLGENVFENEEMAVYKLY